MAKSRKGSWLLVLWAFVVPAYATVTYNGTSGVNTQVFSAICNECHFSGSGLPNWQDYTTASGSSALIVTRVNANEMPPPPHAFNPLPANLKSLLSAWNSAGAPQTATVQATVTGYTATSITKTSATLEAGLKENGAETSVRIRYKRTVDSTWIGATNSTAVGTGGDDVFRDISRSVTGLTCSTDYHYRVETIAAVALSLERNFSTLDCSGPVITNTSNVALGTSVAVNMSEDNDPTAFSLTIRSTADTASTQSLTWSFDDLPDFGTASFGGSSSVAGSPVADRSVTYAPNAHVNADTHGAPADSFIIRVTDNTDPTNLFDTITVNVNIAAVNDAPLRTGGTVTLSAANEASALVGYSVAASFSDVDGNDLDYALTSGSLPAGVSLTAATGALTGTPTVPGIYSFSITATETDGSPSNLSSLAQAFSLTINENSNDAPQRTGGTITLAAANEDSALAGVSVDGDFSDEEGNTLNYARTSGSLPTGTVLNATTGAITGTPTVPGIYSFGITATETNGAGGNLASAEQAYSWTINNVNDAPQITTNNGLTLLELTTETITSTELAATDEDTADTAPVLTFTVTTAPTSGTVNLDGTPLGVSDTFTQDDINNNRVTYTETSGGTGDSFVFTLKDDENAGPTGQSFSITISPNSPPVLTAGATLNYTENDGAQVIDNTVTITDTENDDIVSASVRISGNYQSGEDVLGFTNQNGITGSFDSGTGILSLTGTTTIANYRTALRSVTYTNTSEDPSVSARTVTFTVTDVVNPSNGVTSTINVSKANDLPTSSNNTVSTAEDTPRNLVTGDFPFVDVDSADSLVSVQIIQLPGAGSLTRSGSPVVDDQVIAVADLNGNLVFTPDNNENGSPYTTLSFKVSDGAVFSTADYTLTINVGASNDSPETVGGTIALATQTENAALSGVSVTSGFTDPENNDLDYAQTSGSLPTGVSLNTASGAITGTPTISGVFNFGITATETDGTGLSSPEQAFSLTVNGVNDAPAPVGGTVTLPNIDAGFAIAGVNVTSGFTDEENNTLSYALSIGSLPDGVTINANGDLQGTPTSWGMFSFSVIATETNGNPTNLSSVAQAFSLTVDADDTDSDTVPDFIDNCPADANTPQTDTDGDGEGDVCDADDDGDGMPDDFEDDNSLDPLDSSDAGEDADGDGVINLDEYLQGTNPNVDSVPPQFSGVGDITVNAIGYLTPVDLSDARALDIFEGRATTPGIDSVTGTTSLSKARLSLFNPGRTVITWTASDSNGNVGTANQTINVRPLANLLPNQVAVEGGVVQIGVSLNGEAPDPVTFDYTVSGTASSTDYDVSGSFSIGSGDTSGAIAVNLNDDGVMEGSETLIVTLSNPQNAVLGNKISHTVVINEGNIAPAVTLNVAQAANTGPLIARDAGTVTITAAASDLNIGDTFTYDWSQLHGFLIALNGTGGSGSNTFEFDPTGLDAGVYEAAVSVTDSGSPVAATSARVALNLKESSPVLAAIDSDGDGINDDVEGYQDVDGNGIVDYLDPFSSASGINLIPNQTGQLQKTLLVQTDAGLKLRMSGVGLSTGATGALVSQQNIATYVSQSGGAATLSEDMFRNIGGIFDFEIYGLPVGESANVVLPLSSGILLDAEYRKFDLQNGWHTFMANTNNGIRSAKSVGGVCPAPGHESYTMGLTVFNNCVQLTVQDGGPNDADGEANGVIRDPGGVAVADVTPEHEVPEVDDGGSGGGMVHPLIILCLLVWRLATISRMRCVNNAK